MQNQRIVYATALLSVMVTVGCDPSSSSGPAEGELGVTLEQALTPGLANAVTQGMLPLPPLPSESNMISAGRASELADAFISQFGAFFLDELEAAHGGSIDLDNLTASARVFFAETPDARLPEGALAADKKGFGSYYIVTLYQAQVPAVSVAVSALNTDLAINVRGGIDFPVRHGNDFQFIGLSEERRIPLTPEQAAIRVHEATGARVANVIRLVKPATGTFTANYAAWEVQLERSVTAEMLDGSEATTDIVYVAPHGFAVGKPELADRMFTLEIGGERVRARIGFNERVRPFQIVKLFISDPKGL